MRLTVVMLPVVALACAGASATPTASPDSRTVAASSEVERVEDVAGTVRKVGDLGWGLVPEADPGTRYDPGSTLPEAFREDGLAVIFSGEVRAPEPNVRRWGTPIELTSIRRADGTPDG